MRPGHLLRRITPIVIVLAVTAGTGAWRPASAAPRQIDDPAMDHPVPFLDLTGVRLALVRVRGIPALEVTFALAGDVSPGGRATMTGYSFTAKVGGCDLLVRFIGNPDAALFASAGAVATRCGASGRDVKGAFKLNGREVVVTSTLRDLKTVAPGMTMTKLRAFTSPGEGMYHDDTTAPSALGDSASSDKPWTIA